MVKKKNSLKKTFLKDFDKYKEGLIIGGLTGAAAAFQLVNGGYDLSSLYESGKGLMDDFLGRSASVAQTAVYKLYAVMVSLGMTFGYMVDRLMTKYFNKKKMSSLRARKRRK